jgi:threonine synthase
VEAFRGREHLRTLVLFPEGRISEVQRRFMTTTGEANVRAVAVQGSFDDCQAIVKSMFNDAPLRQAVDLSGVNSINWARIAAQSVYYFTSAAALGAPARKVAYTVPTGNFGDAFAGYVAHAMGLPIERITVATNANDIVSRALDDGRYARGPVQHTQSPAMDIQIASNFERLYFEATDRESLETARAFRAFADSGAITLPPKAAAAMRRLFAGQAVSEADTAKTIVATLNETGELIDPHTAVAMAAARRQRSKPGGAPMVVLSTAHPAKFPEAVMAAAGAVPKVPPSCLGIGERPERFDRLPADAETVKAYLRAFAEA